MTRLNVWMRTDPSEPRTTVQTYLDLVLGVNPRTIEWRWQGPGFDNESPPSIGFHQQSGYCIVRIIVKNPFTWFLLSLHRLRPTREGGRG